MLQGDVNLFKKYFSNCYPKDCGRSIAHPHGKEPCRQHYRQKRSRKRTIINSSQIFAVQNDHPTRINLILEDNEKDYYPKIHVA